MALEEFEALLEAASQRETLIEAVIQVLAGATGVPVHRVHAKSGVGEESLLLDGVVFAMGERAVVQQFQEHSALAWSPAMSASWYLLSARVELLATTLRTLRAASGTPEKVLRIPHLSLRKARVQASGALSMWWDDRIAEGHTRDSARLLLGMTLDPLMWAELRWPDAGSDDDAPHFHWCRVSVHHPATPPSRGATAETGVLP